jgi:redox-sensing transcriptional repressor
MHINIGIITVPAEFAQDVADRLVKSGIKAIWNFALIKLNVPENVLVQNENLAASLAVLSQHLMNEMGEKK